MLRLRPSRPAVFAILLCTGTAVGQDRPRDQQSFFGLSNRWDVKLTVTSENLAKMYPAGRVRMGLSQAKGVYKYVKGDIEIAGHRLGDVGLRFKGNSTYWSTTGHLKKSFKVDFNRFVADQQFLGLKKINLQNNVTDPSQIREAVSYQVYRDAGVPACRTCFARVYLTVEGEFDNEYLGNYTIVEQVDRQFLVHNFGDRGGLIVKPEGRVMPFLGDTWDSDYVRAYVPKTSVEESHAEPLIGMARLIAQSDDRVLAEGIDQVLDVSEFLNYCAVTVYLSNMDSPLRLAHNFYMAVPAGTMKVVWLPWDLNLSLGGFGMGGSSRATSVYKPTDMPLFRRLIGLPKYRKIYEQHLTSLARGPGSPKTMAAHLALARRVTAEGIAGEADRSDVITRVAGRRSGFDLGSLMRLGRTGSIDEAQDRFVAGRAQRVLDELAGKIQGQAAPRNLFGGFGRVRRTGPRESMVALRDMLARSKILKLEANGSADAKAVAAAARELFARIDRDRSGSMTRSELVALLRSQRGEDASPSEARRILREFDADRDRKLSRAEWVAAYARGLGKWDGDQDGKLSRVELTGK